VAIPKSPLNKTPLKTIRGCIAASPNRPNKLFSLAYLFFFFDFFFAAILFSSKLLGISRQQCWRSAYSITMYSDSQFSCQEKSESPTQEIAGEEIERRRTSKWEVAWGKWREPQISLDARLLPS
jgi:hypothetical protein